MSSEYANGDTVRELDLIIHGLEEDKVSDTESVKEIFEATATPHTPSFMNRLGLKKDGKIRPLMLRMNNIDEKEEFMSKLWMLNEVRMRFKGMSITNDYTLEERMMIKKFVEEANRRNEIETSENRWKVRGTPSGGLRLVKITN